VHFRLSREAYWAQGYDDMPEFFKLCVDAEPERNRQRDGAVCGCERVGIGPFLRGEASDLDRRASSGHQNYRHRMPRKADVFAQVLRSVGQVRVFRSRNGIEPARRHMIVAEVDG